MEVIDIVSKMNRKHGKLAMLYHYYLRVVYGCDIMPGTKIGGGTRFPHRGLGVVINKDCVIGKNCTIGKGVVIGGRSGNPVVPKIGDNVLVGSNAVIIGPIKIGDNAQIGAGAVVVHDVPENAVVVGNPARVIKINGMKCSDDDHLTNVKRLQHLITVN